MFESFISQITLTLTAELRVTNLGTAGLRVTNMGKRVHLSLLVCAKNKTGETIARNFYLSLWASWVALSRLLLEVSLSVDSLSIYILYTVYISIAVHHSNIGSHQALTLYLRRRLHRSWTVEWCLARLRLQVQYLFTVPATVSVPDPSLRVGIGAIWWTRKGLKAVRRWNFRHRMSWLVSQ